MKVKVIMLNKAGKIVEEKGKAISAMATFYEDNKFIGELRFIPSRIKDFTDDSLIALFNKLSKVEKQYAINQLQGKEEEKIEINLKERIVKRYKLIVDEYNSRNLRWYWSKHKLDQLIKEEQVEDLEKKPKKEKKEVIKKKEHKLSKKEKLEIELLEEKLNLIKKKKEVCDKLLEENKDEDVQG